MRVPRDDLGRVEERHPRGDAARPGEVRVARFVIAPRRSDDARVVGAKVDGRVVPDDRPRLDAERPERVEDEALVRVEVGETGGGGEREQHRAGP